MANLSLLGSSIDFMRGAEARAGSHKQLLLSGNSQLSGKITVVLYQSMEMKAFVETCTRPRDGTEEATTECGH